MKRIIAIVLAIMLATGSVCITQDVSAKRMTKRGVYLGGQKKISIKFTSNRIIIKGPLKYGKKLSLSQRKYKKIGKGKKTFKLAKRVKYYVASVGYSRRSKKDAKGIMKDICEFPGSVYFHLFMKGKKVYKIVFTQ